MEGAALEDVRELVNQLTSRFRISQVILVGSSRGGVLGLRLLARHPSRFAGVVAAVPALCMASPSGPPDCVGSYYEEATREIYAAARAGRFDDRLVVAVVGASDDNRAIVAGNQHLFGLLDGRPHYRRHLADGGHENYLSGAYNQAAVGRFAWLISNPAAPTLEAELDAFLARRSAAMTPEPGWTPPPAGGEYLIPTGPAPPAVATPAPVMPAEPFRWPQLTRRRALGGAILVVGVVGALWWRRKRG
jgi:pimeloyl-ACP methyl ester carboxylesterase